MFTRKQEIKSIAIVGAGPAGSALGIHLAKRGLTVRIFDTGRRPELVVGESLVPAVIPLLQELGVEDAVARIGTYKPGATFHSTPDQENSFVFARAGKKVPSYAYNVPRNEFDAILQRTAGSSGATIISHRATVEDAPQSGQLQLDKEALRLWCASTGIREPDLIVDASGRNRSVAKLLKLPSWEGSRKDTALFAHFSSLKIPHVGHIHINRLHRGWSWRIPLPDRVSLGMVVPHEALKGYGDSAEDQFDRMCRGDATLRSFLDGGTRTTSVMKYSNYQLSSHRWCGDNWALVGDAGGFIDPIFSSGLLLSLEGASVLATTIVAGWSRTAAMRYEATMVRKMNAWRGLIDSFYDGRMFSLFRLSSIYGASSDSSSLPSKIIARKVDQQLALALSGVAPTSRRRLWLLHTLLNRLGASKHRPRLRIP